MDRVREIIRLRDLLGLSLEQLEAELVQKRRSIHKRLSEVER